jgi:hypothetical protein
MSSSKQPRQSEPVWWSVQHTLVWTEHLPALRREFQRRTDAQRREEIASLGPDDTVIQRHPTTPRNVGIERAHAVPDNDWEVGTAWEQIEPALRFGVGACVQYSYYVAWNGELEGLLNKDWDATNIPGTWEKMKRAVRHGFEAARRKLS